MLIVTLPNVYRSDLLEEIISHPLVDGVRYNVGYCSAYSPQETLARIMRLIEQHRKKFWLDLKGRQLRIVNWAVPNYGKIVLNHAIKAELPAQVFFRGNEWSELKVVRGNVIYVDPPPAQAVGEGQAINIHSQNLEIDGYLTPEDEAYLAAAATLGIHNFMLSFVEGWNDIQAVIIALGDKYDKKKTEFVLKIESPAGLSFVANDFKKLGDETLERQCGLMAARDDLLINIGANKAMILTALQQIIKNDPEAIVASRIFSGLETAGAVTMGDYSDMCLMSMFGYKHVMLSDNISSRHFSQAIKAWQDYLAFRQQDNAGKPVINNSL